MSLFKLQNSSGGLARWVLKLQQYDFIVKYKQGVLHKVQDNLSRMHQDEKEVKITVVPLNETVKDTWYFERYESVRKAIKGFRNYEIVKGLLYY